MVIKAIKKYFQRIRGCKCYDKILETKSREDNIRRNIYGKNITVDEYIKKQKRVHIWFKYACIYPIIGILRKVLGKHLVKKVSDSPEYKNVRLFDTAFENALYDWNKCFRLNLGARADGSKVTAKLDKLMKSNASNMLRSIKEFMITILHNDTAYFEFMNCLFFNITLMFNKNYGDKVDHVFYTDRCINDVRYFVITGELPIETKQEILNLLSQGNVKLEIVGENSICKKK